MKRKIVCFLLIASVLVFSPGSAVMAQDDSLDIEKTAIMAIKNSQSLQTLDKTIKLQTQSTQSAAQSAKQALAHANGASAEQLVKTIVLAPLEADNALKQMSNNRQVTVNTLRFSAYTQYIALLKANYAVNIQKDLMDNMESDYKKAQLQLNQGLITQNGERLAEINYLKSVYQYNSAVKSLDSAYMAINNFTGVDIKTRYSTLIDNNVIPASSIKSLDEYVQSALTNRTEIINAQNTLDTKKKEFDYGRSELQSEYQWYIQQNQYEIDSAENTLETQKINIQLEITNAYKTLQSDMMALDTQQANYNLAEANYKAAEIQYNNASITLNDLQSAKISEAQAKMNLKNAQLNAWLMQMKMDSGCGVGPAVK